MQGVTRNADVGAGVLGTSTTPHRAAAGDARGTTRTLNREAIYDYQDAAASGNYGVTVWMDVRNASDCAAADVYRQSLDRPDPDSRTVPAGRLPARHRERRHLQRLLPRPDALTTPG